MDIRTVTTPQELEGVRRLRYECYVEELGWKYEQADEETKTLSDPLDDSGLISYVEEEGRVVATYCIHFGGTFELPEKWRHHYGLEHFREFPESALSFSSRLMVLPHLRGSSVVPRMLMKAYEECWKRGARFNFCYCRPRLVDLYERLGFMRYKANIVEPTQGYMVPMVLVNEDATHLKAVRSPFLKICQGWRPDGATREWFDRTFPGMRTLATKPRVTPEDFWNEWSEAMSGEHVTLLKGFTSEQVKALLQSGIVLQCRSGDTLLHEGEAGHEMFLILEGMARFSQRRENGSESQIGIAGQGEAFGEAALVSQAKRTASVQAITDMQVLVISHDFLQRAMKSLPEITIKLLYNLTQVLAQKLSATTLQWQASLRENEKLALWVANKMRSEGKLPPAAPKTAEVRTSVIRKTPNQPR